MENNVKDAEKNKREVPAGILRSESGKSRRTSFDLKLLTQGEPTSPQPSVDRLSVTFAEDSVKSDSSKCNYYCPGSTRMDKVHFPQGTDANPEMNESDEEDYSASVNAIIQRRASTRKSRRRSSRRASSPFSPDILLGSENGRRRSSVFTSSSGETAITIDENMVGPVTQEQIFENIKLHKEVLSSVKMQPWNMRKKLKLVVQAKNYIKKHEGALQERYAQSRSTRDMLARWNIYLVKKWQHYRRELANFSNWVIPWERKIKEIESHFGSVVASYFLFLRWLFWVNIVLAVVLISFVAVPEMLTANTTNDPRKQILPEEKYSSTNFQTLWDFEGILRYSPLFYGWYTNIETKTRGYWMPLAYFLTGVVAYAYSFFATLRKMAENSRMSKLSEKDDECIFSWKLFTAWDYMIGNAETAHNRIASIVVGFKEALLEEAEKKRESRNWKITSCRILVNAAVLGLLTFSAWAVVVVVGRSTDEEAKKSVWRSNESTYVMTIINTTFPVIFECLGFFEHYHPRKQLRLQLARIMVLNLLNLYSLIFAHFFKINKMSNELENWRQNMTLHHIPSNTDLTMPTLTTNVNTSLQTYSAVLECYRNCFMENNLLTPASLVATVVYPIIQKKMSDTTTESNENVIYSEYKTKVSVTPPGYSESNMNFSTNYETDFSEEHSSPFSNNISDSSENYTLIPTTMNYTDVNVTSDFDSVQEAFVGFLTYILWGFTHNETYNEHLATFNLPDITSDSVITYEMFKTTMTPFLNISSSELDRKYGDELTTIFSEIETTMTSFKNYTLVRKDCEYCRQFFCAPSTSSTEMSTPFLIIQDSSLNYTERKSLRSKCWETMFGQELVKLTVMDLFSNLVSSLLMDLIRGIFVRVMNRCWCWDLEKKFPQYGDFKVAENILHLVNNQGMVWMGMFFSPGIVALNVFKLLVLMYFRAWIVLTCNVPHEIIFRASRSNNFYYALLLMMLFLCVLPVGYAIVWVKPSWNCGPFSTKERIFHIFTETIKAHVPKVVEKALDYIASPGIVIPLLLLLILIIYYLISLTNALREANNDLKTQLRRERTEERRKMFQIVDRRRRQSSGGSGDFSNTPFAKWKKILGNMPGNGKSFDDTTPRQDSNDYPQIKEEQIENNKNKDFFSKMFKKALGKSSTSDEENQDAQNFDEGTDTEQHESLPEDLPPKPSSGPNSFDFSRSAIMLQKKNSLKSSSDSSEKHAQMKDTKPIVPVKGISQDSGSSLRSDNVPVITISKTESAEGIDDDSEITKDKPVGTIPSKSDPEKFKPTVKCVLKKQSTEIDEDQIRYFNKDLGMKPSLARFDENFEENAASATMLSESSDDTAREDSADTVVDSRNVMLAKGEETEEIKDENAAGQTSSGSATESSAAYDDITSM